MSFFRRLFSKKEQPSDSLIEKESIGRQEKEIQFRKRGSSESLESEWRTVPNYIAADEEEYEIVSLIVTAIAAGDKPESQFKIKKIMKVNPEVELVSVIAAAIAAGDNSERKYIVKSVKQKNDRRMDDVKEI
ncbi:hypothetical protein ACWN8V_03035 [Vagococcus elongatus]|uniref:Uncharacterized protein n=1 Tax=Vagococcus elongatus TaxID=180344 RepID=A0A430B1V6_9ENTE|nr:hypothetical protein [Vagococcus elongatus]RSU14315.1 hypothetical protein CBF29_03165 [Vagococcus elongatus]